MLNNCVCLLAIVAFIRPLPLIGQGRSIQPFFTEITDRVGLKSESFKWSGSAKFIFPRFLLHVFCISMFLMIFECFFVIP